MSVQMPATRIVPESMTTVPLIFEMWDWSQSWSAWCMHKLS